VSHLSQRFVFPHRERHDVTAAEALTNGRQTALFGVEQLGAAQWLDLPGLFANAFYIAHAVTDPSEVGSVVIGKPPQYLAILIFVPFS
jgi:hypothetical protein